MALTESEAKKENVYLKKVIDEINDGSISSIDEIDEIIIEMCPKL